MLLVTLLSAKRADLHMARKLPFHKSEEHLLRHIATKKENSGTSSCHGCRTPSTQTDALIRDAKRLRHIYVSTVFPVWE